MRSGGGLLRREFVPLRRETAREDLCARRRQVVDARPLAKRALLLSDKSAYNYYTDFAEKGYYNRIIAGNINQVLQVDSVVCNFDRYPYEVKTYARQMIIRESNVTERSLVTRCRLLNASRSDDNPGGFTIEGFTILENRDLQTLER